MRVPRSPQRGIPYAATALVMALATLSSCGDSAPPTAAEPDPDPVATRVTVISPVDTVMAVGRSAELSALAEDAAGRALTGLTFTWRSSDEAVATVSAAGTVEGLAEGATTIQAEAGGATGTLPLRVVAADLAAISTLLEDAFTQSLVSGLGTAAGDAVRAALDDCTDALAVGHVRDVLDCVVRIQSESSGEPTDRVLLAVLDIVSSRAEVLLNL